MLSDLSQEVRSIRQVLEEIEAFVLHQYSPQSNQDCLFVESIEDLINLAPKIDPSIPLADPTPKLDVHVKRLIRTMPPSYCNLFIRTEDKRHYFSVVENEFGIFVVFLPCEKAKSVCIKNLKDNLLEL